MKWLAMLLFEITYWWKNTCAFGHKWSYKHSSFKFCERCNKINLYRKY